MGAREVKGRAYRRCLDRAMKIMDRRGKLLGLDKPQKVEHSGSIVTDPEAEAAALIDELLAGKEADAFAAGFDALSQENLTRG